MATHRGRWNRHLSTLSRHSVQRLIRRRFQSQPAAQSEWGPSRYPQRNTQGPGEPYPRLHGPAQSGSMWAGTHLARLPR